MWIEFKEGVYRFSKTSIDDSIETSGLSLESVKIEHDVPLVELF